MQVGISELGAGGHTAEATLKQILLRSICPECTVALVAAGDAPLSRHSVTRHSRGEAGSSR